MFWDEKRGEGNFQKQLYNNYYKTVPALNNIISQ